MSRCLVELLRSIIDGKKDVSPMDYAMLIHQIASQSRITEEILNELRNMRCILNRKGNYIYPHEALMSKTDSFNDDRFLDDILGRLENADL